MNELVLFGITGDLARQKLIPALYNLYTNRKIDKKTSFIGFGRKKFSKVDFQNFIEQVIEEKSSSLSSTKNSTAGMLADTAAKREFSSQWSYIQSELDDSNGYIKLAKALMTNQTLVYVSLPPMLQLSVCNQLISSGVLVKNSNRKLMLEKPYGFDSESAQKLESFLTRRLKKEQVLRVDHYAGKQALVEIENVARQGIFREILSSVYIKKIEVRLNESIDVSTRGKFYDKVGALNDIGQNHMLHMLTTILAVPEVGQFDSRRTRMTTSSESLLSRLRSEALSLVKIQRTPSQPILGQYSEFKSTNGVAENSTTETFFKFFAKIKKGKTAIAKRWGGVHLELTGGKALNSADVSVTLYPNSKKMEPIRIPVNSYGDRDAYEQIFRDSFFYNSDRFIDFEQIKKGWKIVEGVKNMVKKGLVIYKKGAYPQDILRK